MVFSFKKSNNCPMLVSTNVFFWGEMVQIFLIGWKYTTTIGFQTIISPLLLFNEQIKCHAMPSISIDISIDVVHFCNQVGHCITVLLSKTSIAIITSHSLASLYSQFPSRQKPPSLCPYITRCKSLC